MFRVSQNGRESVLKHTTLATFEAFLRGRTRWGVGVALVMLSQHTFGKPESHSLHLARRIQPARSSSFFDLLSLPGKTLPPMGVRLKTSR